MAALGQGPECLKESLPSLSKRLKLLGAIQVLQASLVSSSQSSKSTVCFFLMYVVLSIMISV